MPTKWVPKPQFTGEASSKWDPNDIKLWDPVERVVKILIDTVVDPYIKGVQEADAAVDSWLKKTPFFFLGNSYDWTNSLHPDHHHPCLANPQAFVPEAMQNLGGLWAEECILPPPTETPRWGGGDIGVRFLDFQKGGGVSFECWFQVLEGQAFVVIDRYDDARLEMSGPWGPGQWDIGIQADVPNDDRIYAAVLRLKAGTKALLYGGCLKRL